MYIYSFPEGSQVPKLRHVISTENDKIGMAFKVERTKVLVAIGNKQEILATP